MCIAILNLSKKISKTTLQTCWNNNKDGAGMAYIESGKLTTFKHLRSFDKFYKHYSDARDRNKNSAFLLHFRIATHGKVNEENCHPFMIDNNTAFIHNGIISNEYIGTSHLHSDTSLFNEDILKQLPANFMDNFAILALIEEFIGHSKLIFLRSDNTYHISNESLGHWIGDNWFSNHSYQEYVAPPKQSYYKRYWGNMDDDKFTDDKCECISCGEINPVKEMVYNKDYNCELCKDCMLMF